MSKKLYLFLIVAICAIKVQGQTIFKDERYGFSMEKPKDWFVGDKKMQAENLDKLEFSQEDLAKILKDNNGSVLLSSFYKYDPKNHVGMIPTIQIIVRSNPAKNFEQFHQVISNSAESFKTIFKDFAYSVKPEVREIDGIKSSYFIGNYTLTGKDGESSKINVRCYAIPKEAYFFQLTFIDEEGNKENLALFDQLIGSIKIAKK